MNTHTPRLFSSRRFAATATAVALGLLAMILPGTSLAASCSNGSGGGLAASSVKCKPVKKARLIRGRAVAPTHAPRRVKQVIAWANKIRNKPYVWGGGHASFNSSGYDCSGAVSYALRGGRFLSSPLASPGLMSWQRGGKGKWITVYSNPGHAYLVVAGLRFDTSMTPGNGPGWSTSLRSTPGRFTARHPGGY
ncbi:MAG: hypothetical protein M9938_05440 [Solirubrobacterales bacterium]|nr:hypothetical protein [Solirubrobacterales bacterium]